MTDTQVLTIALSLVIAISALIHSNSRITEAKETLRAEMQTLRTEMNARLEKLEAKIDARFDKLTDLLKAHELEHHR